MAPPRPCLPALSPYLYEQEHPPTRSWARGDDDDRGRGEGGGTQARISVGRKEGRVSDSGGPALLVTHSPSCGHTARPLPAPSPPYSASAHAPTPKLPALRGQRSAPSQNTCGIAASQTRAAILPQGNRGTGEELPSEGEEIGNVHSYYKRVTNLIIRCRVLLSLPCIEHV